MAKNSSGFVFHHTTECSLIRIEDVADFEIRDGRQIRVWPAAETKQKDIEIFLFGPAWASLCHQRGMLPLHASAIVTGAGITAFAGRSGAGKSTTAALLNSLGYELISDDILPVNFDQNSDTGSLAISPSSQAAPRFGYATGLYPNGSSERGPRQT